MGKAARYYDWWPSRSSFRYVSSFERPSRFSDLEAGLHRRSTIYVRMVVDLNVMESKCLLEDYFPMSLVHMFGLLQITSSSANGLWLVRIMILSVIPANIPLFMEINLFWLIWTIAITLVAWDAHQSLRRYIPEDVLILMGDHLHARHLNMRINILVLFGILAAVSLTAYGSYFSFYCWDDRNRSIISAVSFLTFATRFFLLFAIFIPIIYIICNLMGSDIGQ